MRRSRLFAFIGILAALSGSAEAAGKKRPQVPDAPKDGKRVISLAPIEDTSIELPDGSRYHFGKEFEAALIERLGASGRFVVVEPESVQASENALARQQGGDEFYLPGSAEPAATLSFGVDALSFTTGARGERIQYGFDERIRNPFSSGELENEFPLRVGASEPGWFGDIFRVRGKAPFDSKAGLDLGDGVQLDLLFAWLGVKYAKYHSELHLRLEIDAPLAGRHETKTIAVSGDGFFSDVVAGYLQYSAGIELARTDAMLKSFRRAIDGAVMSVIAAVDPLPSTGILDAIFTKDGQTYYSLGTGIGSDIAIGTRYEAVNQPSIVFSVVKSEARGAVGQLVSGDPSQVQIGMKLIEVTAAAEARVAALARAPASSAPDRVALSPQVIPEVKFKQGQAPRTSRFQAFLKSLTELVFLPYRIWRYFQYDQGYHRDADSDAGLSVSDMRQSVWARQIGLDRVSEDPPSRGDGVAVAIIDSGIDYNHPFLHDSLWLNAEAFQDLDGRTDHYGWDFISGDSRPYDDGEHGTEVASLLHAVAPTARLIPVKIFNAWGVTSSAAIYSAFVYAVDHGAQIILCAWATERDSLALRKGVEYAGSHGVAVVAAAGDEGADLSMRPFYPAALTADHLLVVASVDTNDALLAGPSTDCPSNYGERFAGIAAPGRELVTALPRSGSGRDSGSGLSAAIAAGALARVVSANPHSTPREWIRELETRAERVPALIGKVADGRRLKLSE